MANPAKIANPVFTRDFNGTPYRVGKLTLGAALEIESYLSELKTPYEILQDSKALEQIGKELADQLVSKALQETHFWPPDAITALCTQKFLVKADFGIAFLSAVLRHYNPHLQPDEILVIAKNATTTDVVEMQLIAFGANETDPKDENAAGQPTMADLASEPIGVASSPT